MLPPAIYGEIHSYQNPANRSRYGDNHRVGKIADIIIAYSVSSKSRTCCTQLINFHYRLLIQQEQRLLIYR